MGARIALFTRDLAGGGIGRVIVNLATGFAERGHDVDIVLARRRGPYLAQLAPGVRVIDLGVDRTLRCVPGLVRYLRRERPRALLACADGANVVALWAKRLAGSPVRLLISTHTSLSRNAREASQARGRLIPYFVRRFYPWADDVIAVSQGVADDLAATAQLDRERIRVIYNPVDIRGIIEAATAPLDHPWFGPGEPPVIVSAGRLTRQKDYPTLIRAFGRVRQRRPARLLILGEGEDRPALEALARELGVGADLSLPGFVANPYPFLAAARLFVLSSAWEGFGNVLIEAMALGTPVIATDCPSGPAEILGHGRYGTLVPVGDHVALAQAMASGLRAGGPVHGGRERAAHFATDRIAAEYLQAMAG
ncbi:MAG: glycosyl transferase group 1 [Thermomicrobiales bacterium]|nr:glycosyl transferase group 1 [Thermomicrobiales bacterium]